MNLIQSASKFKIGTIIDAVGAPDSSWMRCNGEVLLQSDYPLYFANAQNPHPTCWQQWEEIASYPASSRKVMSKMGDIIVATPSSGQTVSYSTDGGDTWTESGNVLPSSGNWSVINNNGTRFVALRYGSTAGAYSTDGVNWNSLTMPASGNWAFLVWNGTVFMAGALSGGTIYYSSDGITWNTGASLSATIFAFSHNTDTAGNLLLLDSNRKIRKSTDGTTLSTSTDPVVYSPANDFNSFKFMNGKWWTNLETSPRWFGISDNNDGVNWEIRYLINQDRYNDFFIMSDACIWTGEEYLFLDSSYGSFAYWVGKDGYTWSPRYYYSHPECFGSIFLSKEKGVLVMNQDLNAYRRIFRINYTHYDYTTHFQLPNLVPSVPGIYKYIKVR